MKLLKSTRRLEIPFSKTKRFAFLQVSFQIKTPNRRRTGRVASPTPNNKLEQDPIAATRLFSRTLTCRHGKEDMKKGETETETEETGKISEFLLASSPADRKSVGTTKPQHRVKVGTRCWGKSRKNKCQRSKNKYVKKNKKSKAKKQSKTERKEEVKYSRKQEKKDKRKDKGKPTCYALTCVHGTRKEAYERRKKVKREDQERRSR